MFGCRREMYPIMVQRRRAIAPTTPRCSSIWERYRDTGLNVKKRHDQQIDRKDGYIINGDSPPGGTPADIVR